MNTARLGILYAQNPCFHLNVPSFMPIIYFLLILLLLFAPLEASAAVEYGLKDALGVSPVYIFFILLFFHLPYVVISFFYVVDGQFYNEEKKTSLRYILTFFAVVNTILFGIPIFKGVYIYPSLLLWLIPSLWSWMGYVQWRMPAFNFVTTALYLVTMTLFIQGGYKNYKGFGPKDGTHQTYYSEEQVKTVETYSYGLKHGEFLHYYPKGELKKKVHYHYDTLEGKAQTFYANGQLQEAFNYHQGKLSGQYQSYYPNGQLKRKQEFENGLLDGPSKSYYKSGQLQSALHYKKGTKDSLCKTFYPSGQLKTTCFYEEAKGRFKAYYENGQLQAVGDLQGDAKVGPWEYYHENGALAATGYYVAKDYAEAVKEGLWKTYYPNGQLRTKGSFKQGIRNGVWIKYFETGEQSDQHDYGT